MSQTNLPAPTPEEARSVRASAALGRHGYAFQNAVTRRVLEMHGNQRSSWQFEAAEFPVELNGETTRIDIVLRRENDQLWIAGECKRVYPDHAEWMFFSSSNIRRGQPKRTKFVCEVIEKPSGTPQIQSYPVGLDVPEAHNVHYGLEVPIVPTDRQKGSPEEIEKALGQVLRCSNGLAQFIEKQPHITNAGPSLLIPVIFTTAKLFVRKGYLNDVDLSRGSLQAEQIELSEEPWVYYHYHMSGGLRHSIPVGEQRTDPPYVDPGLTRYLAKTAIRSVAIVNVDHLDLFLGEFGSPFLEPRIDRNIC